jgi:hypothetical protein
VEVVENKKKRKEIIGNDQRIVSTDYKRFVDGGNKVPISMILITLIVIAQKIVNG